MRAHHAAHSCWSWTEVHTEREAQCALCTVRDTPGLSWFNDDSVKDKAHGLLHSCFLWSYVTQVSCTHSHKQHNPMSNYKLWTCKHFSLFCWIGCFFGIRSRVFLPFCVCQKGILRRYLSYSKCLKIQVWSLLISTEWMRDISYTHLMNLNGFDGRNLVLCMDCFYFSDVCCYNAAGSLAFYPGPLRM